jgi:hypothetical protein
MCCCRMSSSPALRDSFERMAATRCVESAPRAFSISTCGVSRAPMCSPASGSCAQPAASAINPVFMSMSARIVASPSSTFRALAAIAGWEDNCGGLHPGDAEKMFQPLKRRAARKSPSSGSGCRSAGAASRRTTGCAVPGRDSRPKGNGVRARRRPSSTSNRPYVIPPEEEARRRPGAANVAVRLRLLCALAHTSHR